MMQQRRRMLMSQLTNIEKAFQTASFIASDGHNSSASTGSAEIGKSYLPNGKKYYLFGYYSNNFAIFSYYNGVITNLYAKSSSSTLSLDDTGTALRLRYSTSGIYANNIGLTALTFKYVMDDVFKNLSDEVIAGLSANSASYATLVLSNFISAGETKYFFAGSNTGFCVYKAVGTAYSGLTAIFNHNLYLIYWNSTSLALSLNNSSATNLYGYTVLSVKE